jgi:hypothetical protein
MKKEDWIDLQNKNDDFWDGWESFGKMLLLRARGRNKKMPKYIEGEMLANWIKLLMKKRHKSNVRYESGTGPRWV